MDDDDGRDHHAPYGEKAHQATQSKDPHPTQVWGVPPQPVGELVMIGSQQWQHHQEAYIEKNVAYHGSRAIKVNKKRGQAGPHETGFIIASSYQTSLPGPGRGSTSKSLRRRSQ